MKFERVSLSEYQDQLNNTPNLGSKKWGESIFKMYSNIKLPVRATKGSAGYDFFAPYDLTIPANTAIVVPTGIKVKLDDDKFLAIYPRSSLGFKFKMMMANTVGIIDSDYYNNEKNEGHIMMKLVNNGDNMIMIKAGEAFAQGIITQYFRTDNDNVTTERVGGMGSTDKNNQ